MTMTCAVPQQRELPSVRFGWTSPSLFIRCWRYQKCNKNTSSQQSLITSFKNLPAPDSTESLKILLFFYCLIYEQAWINISVYKSILICWSAVMWTLSSRCLLDRITSTGHGITKHTRALVSSPLLTWPCVNTHRGNNPGGSAMLQPTVEIRGVLPWRAFNL